MVDINKDRIALNQLSVKGFKKKWILALLLGLTASGCVTGEVQTATKETSVLWVNQAQSDLPKDKTHNAVGESDQKPTKHNFISDGVLSGQQTFQLLTAEMLVKRRQNKEAFQLYYDLVQQTQLPQLAETAFQVSMSTFNVEMINAAADLWLQITPENPKPWRASVILNVREGKITEAVNSFKKFVSLSQKPFEENVATIVSRVAASVKQTMGAEFISALASEYPTEWSVLYNQAKLYSAYSDFEKSLSPMKQALDSAPEHASEQIVTDLAHIYIRLSDAQNGIEVLAPYIETYPRNLTLKELIARLYVQLENYDQAKMLYQDVIERDAGIDSARMSLALIQVEQADFEEAEQHLLKLTSKEGYGVIANYYLGMMKQKQGLDEEALAFFNRVNSGGYQVDAVLRKAEIMFQSYQKYQALELLKAYKSENPADLVKVNKALAIFYRIDEDWQNSLKHYQIALNLAPEDVGLIVATTQVLYRLKQFDDYENLLKNLLKIDSNHADGLNALAYFYVEQEKHLDDAETMLLKANQLNPNSYYIQDSLGWLYYKIGQFQKAVDFIEQAFANEKDEEVFYHLVMAYIKNGQLEKAGETWDEFYAQFSGYEPVKELSKTIESLIGKKN